LSLFSLDAHVDAWYLGIGAQAQTAAAPARPLIWRDYRRDYRSQALLTSPSWQAPGDHGSSDTSGKVTPESRT